MAKNSKSASKQLQQAQQCGIQQSQDRQGGALVEDDQSRAKNIAKGTSKKKKLDPIKNDKNIKPKISSQGSSRLHIVRCEFIVLFIVVFSLFLTVLYIVSYTNFMQAYYQYKGPNSKGEYRQWNGILDWIKSIMSYWKDRVSSMNNNMNDFFNLNTWKALIYEYNWGKWIQYQTWLVTFKSFLGFFSVLFSQIDIKILIIVVIQILIILLITVRISIKLKQRVYVTLIKIVMTIKYSLYAIIFVTIIVITIHGVIITTFWGGIDQQTLIGECNRIALNVGVEAAGQGFYLGDDQYSQVESEATGNHLLRKTAICAKIIMQVYDLGYGAFKVKEYVSEQVFQGQYFEISAQGTISKKSGIVNTYSLQVQVLEINIQSRLNITKFHFSHKTYNILILSSGTLRNPASNKTIIFSPPSASVDSIQQQRIVQLIRARHARETKYYNVKDSVEYFEDSEDVKVVQMGVIVSDLFQRVFRRIGVYCSFVGQKMTTQVLEGTQYYVIMPNYKIVRKINRAEVIVIQDKITQKAYYFTNPQLLPVYPIRSTTENQIPTHIFEYCNKKYEYLSNKRLQQKANNYQIENNTKGKNKGKRVGVVDKYMGEEVAFLKKVLTSNGFQVVFYDRQLPSNYKEQNYDAIVYISGQNVAKSHQLEFLYQKYMNGTGILIWADNDPFFGQANSILQKLQANFKLIGNYQAQGTLRISKQKNMPGTFDIDHPVSDGFISLYQGITICYPNNLPADFQIFAYSTNRALQPSIFYRERYGGRGLLWIDTAFTKLFPSLHGTGKQSEKYTVNVLMYIFRKQEITPY